MKNTKYTLIRNVCFLLGILVILLCVFPPPSSLKHKTIGISTDRMSTDSLSQLTTLAPAGKDDADSASAVDEEPHGILTEEAVHETKGHLRVRYAYGMDVIIESLPDFI